MRRQVQTRIELSGRTHGCVQSHVPFAHHGVANNRTSPWAAHFAVTNVNGALEGADGYTYDLEWSPDAINPPIRQRVRGVPPTYIECASVIALRSRHCESIRSPASARVAYRLLILSAPRYCKSHCFCHELAHGRSAVYLYGVRV